MNDSAVAAIKYALEKCDDDSDSMMFLRYWNEGEFEVLRRNWENIPDEVFTNADPLFKSPAHIEDEREACERWIRQQIGMPSHIAMDWEAPLARYAWLAWKARAALSAPPAAGVPEGWKLVPVEPNPAMLAAFIEAGGKAVRGYKAMLAAAPTPPASEPWHCQHCNSSIAQACRDGGCFGVDAEPASEQQRAVVMPEAEWIDPVALCSCGPAYDAGWRDGVSEAKRLNAHLAKDEGV